MKIRMMVVPFLAIYIGTGSYVLAASTLGITKTPQEMSGTDSASGVEFHASLKLPYYVVIDAYVGTNKRIHAEVDYSQKNVIIRSTSTVDGTPVTLADRDIAAFRSLLTSLPRELDTAKLQEDALGSFVNLIASASSGAVLNVTSTASNSSYTSICNEIGRSGVATYTIGKKVYNTSVTVGPICYLPPDLGRCGALSNSNPGVGLTQRFTQECLNHDQCCVATNGSGICGLSCLGEFIAAVNGYFFASDCGTTAGDWLDNYGFTYALTGGDSTTDFFGWATSLSGTVNTTSCSTWNISGTRNGTSITFMATNPTGGDAYCAASYTYTGAYTNCSIANGSWTNSAGLSGSWSWSRTNTVIGSSGVSTNNALLAASPTSVGTR